MWNCFDTQPNAFIIKMSIKTSEQSVFLMNVFIFLGDILSSIESAYAFANDPFRQKCFGKELEYS